MKEIKRGMKNGIPIALGYLSVSFSFGAIGYLDFTGNMDLCIGIRLAYKRNNEISICSGAGIVYDSVPENEYQECLNKAGAVVEAIKMADGGIDYDSTH